MSLKNPRIFSVHDFFYRMRWNYSLFADYPVDEVTSGNIESGVSNNQLFRSALPHFVWAAFFDLLVIPANRGWAKLQKLRDNVEGLSCLMTQKRNCACAELVDDVSF